MTVPLDQQVSINAFQSTQPSQAVTYNVEQYGSNMFISIHTALAGCDCYPQLFGLCLDISIHTALAGCDITRVRKQVRKHISIHTALAGCDDVRAAFHILNYQFQSTQPSQAVTTSDASSSNYNVISIHTALAGCDGLPTLKWRSMRQISIHTALAGCD